MSSILTNNSAMTALQNLAMTQKSLATTQAQISSGLAVANASDNAAYWSISTTMKSDVGALGAVTNALNLGASVLSSATSALNSVNTILKQMKQDLVTAQTSGTNTAQVQSDIAAQQQSLANIMGSASFNGVNLLDGSTTSTAIVSSFNRNNSSGTGANNTSLGFITVSTTGIALAGTLTGATAPDGTTGAGGLLGASLGLSNSNGYGLGGNAQTAGNYYTSATTTSPDATQGTPQTSTTTGYNGAFAKDSILGFALTTSSSTVPTGGQSDLTTLSNAIDAAISKVTTAGATLGQYSTTVTNQLTYTSSLSEAITSGVGSLVDADMNVASTRLQALQTQQQLGIQALSIANQNSQLILKLFGG